MHTGVTAEHEPVTAYSAERRSQSGECQQDPAGGSRACQRQVPFGLSRLGDARRLLQQKGVLQQSHCYNRRRSGTFHFGGTSIRNIPSGDVDSYAMRLIRGVQIRLRASWWSKNKRQPHVECLGRQGNGRDRIERF